MSKNQSLYFLNDTPQFRCDIKKLNERKRSISNNINLQLTPLNTRNTSLSNFEPNTAKSPDGYLISNIEEKDTHLKETHQQRFKNDINTSTTSSKYFTISSAASLKFRQLIKKYVQ